MNKEDKNLDRLLCLIDGKITVYRQNNNRENKQLIDIQRGIHALWLANRGFKWM